MDAKEKLLRSLVRDVPDFPKPGILFKDITPILGDPAGLGAAIDLFEERWKGAGVTKVAAVESRGFRVARLGERVYDDETRRVAGPGGRTCYFIAGGPLQTRWGRGTDGYAVGKGYVSVTPLALDQTDREGMDGPLARLVEALSLSWSLS